MVKLADLLKVNEKELLLLTNTSDPAAGGAALVNGGAKLVAITLGDRGSFYCSPIGNGYIPPFEVKTVDAVGCGDAFIAGLLSSLVDIGDQQLRLSETQLRHIFTYANAVGALTALTRGVIPALPTARQVEDFLAQWETP
jgi:fructokinase